MRWYVSKAVDSISEINERIKFYSTFRRRNMQDEFMTEEDYFYMFSDGHADNRHMIIGHSDFAVQVMAFIKHLGQKYRMNHKFYVCACIMSYESFSRACYRHGISTNDDIYVSEQELEKIGDTYYYTCEFLNREETRLGFKATQSELCLLTSEMKSFYGNLNRCFIPLEKYKCIEAAIY